MKSYLTYCEDQKDTALKISHRLENAGVEFTHDTRNEEEQNRMKRQMRLTQDPVFLLVSDSFLKSQECMRGVVAFITDMGITRNIRPIILDANLENPSEYTKYWKNKYQEIRAQKDNISKSRQEAYNWQVMIIRRVSNEIALFIEEINKRNPVTLEQFQADNFRAFFAAHGEKSRELESKEMESGEVGRLKDLVDENTETSSADETQKSGFMPPVIPDIFPFSKEKNEVASIAENELNVSEEASEEPTETIVEEEIITKMEVESDAIDEPIDDVIEKKIVGEDELKTFPPENVEQIRDDIFEDEIITEDELKTAPPLAPKFSEENTKFQSKEIRENTEVEAAETDIFSEKINTLSVEITDTDEEEITWTDAQATEVAGNFDVARMQYETLLEKTPYHAEGHYRYGLLLLNQFGEKDAAIEQFEIAVEQKNRYTEAWLKLAYLAEKEEDYLLTKSYYEKIVSYDTENAEAHYRLGNIVSRYFDDQPEKAANYYLKAIELDPEHNDARYEYATLLMTYFNANEEAVEQLEAVIVNEPEHPFAYYDLATIYRKAGRKSKAYKKYKKAVGINSMFKTDKNDKFFKKPKPKQKKCTGKVDTQNYEKLIEQHEVVPVQDAESVNKTLAQAAQYTVLITGATSGIGKATAELFAKNGHRVIITGRRGERLEGIKESFENQYNTTVKTLEFDVRDHRAVTAATDQLTDEWQHIDILINNAGLAAGFSAIHEGNPDDWDTMIDTNIKGLLYMTRAVAPRMVAQGKGHIVNISSIAGKEVYPNGAVYCGTKHAVDAITRGTRMDLVQHGVRVSSISPGHVYTEFADVRYKGDQNRIEKAYADFDPLKATDIADVIFFVATRPESVNIQDVYMFSKQQASAMVVDRSGKVETNE